MYLFDTFYIVERYKNWIVSFEICPHILKTKNQKPNIKKFVRFYLKKRGECLPGQICICIFFVVGNTD